MSLFKLLRSPDVKSSAIVQLCISLTGFVICLFFSIPAAFVLLTVSVALLVIQLRFVSKRQQRLSELCDEIDKILRGAEHVAFDMFREGELSFLSSEVHKMTVRLREQNSALQQDRQFMKEALEDMSHQLRTPLTTMTLILGMLRDPGLSRPERTGYMHEMRDMLARMQWIVETMLSLSRIEAGAVTFRAEAISVSELISSAAEPLSITMELKSITLLTEAEGEPMLIGDRQYLCEAIVNLLKNCIEHTPQGGSITIKTSENSLFTGITITDSGDGIPPEELPHIFDRFYRGAHFSRSGFGIGLAFAQRIITSQNGSLQARSVLPHGAEFDIRIFKEVDT